MVLKDSHFTTGSVHIMLQMKLKNHEPDELNEVLSSLAHVLITGDDTIIVSNEYVKELTTFLVTSMCALRDTGSLSAAPVKPQCT